MATDWERAAAQKRDEVFSLIPKEWIIENPPTREEQRDVTGKYIHQFLTKEEVEITETDAFNIAARTTSGKWKAVDVAKAFCHRAALAHQLTNCLLEIFFVQALERAKELDDYFAKHGKPVGPLHGLPVSLKDQFHVKDVGLTMGYVGWIGNFQGKKGTGKEKKFESELTKELLNLGAVLFVKTSVPHTLMSPESINHISGYVWNPKNRLLSAGGSSGGEGALVGLKGSPLGFGTDIGGSVRIPSACNGLWGLRPSSGRIPYEGAANSMDGQSSILSVIGPLTGSAPSLILALKSILSQQPWVHDPLCLPIPWREEKAAEMTNIINSSGAGRKLAFGVMWDDGIIQTHPPIRRAVSILTEALKKVGHELVPCTPPRPTKDLVDAAIEVFTFDGGSDIFRDFELSGEPPSEQAQLFFGTERRPEVNASKIAEVNVRKREMQKEYLEYWNSTVNKTSTGRPIDAIICPAAPFTSAIRGSFSHAAYTVWVNTLDYTSAIVPVTLADKSIDVKDTNFKSWHNGDQKVQDLYDPELFHGTYASLQLIGRRLEEEKILVLANYISEVLASAKGGKL